MFDLGELVRQTDTVCTTYKLLIYIEYMPYSQKGNTNGDAADAAQRGTELSVIINPCRALVNPTYRIKGLLNFVLRIKSTFLLIRNSCERNIPQLNKTRSAYSCLHYVRRVARSRGFCQF